LKEHNNGETILIKNGIPWKIIWKKEFKTRAEAMALEKKIKSSGAKKFLADAA
jgi:predicted GIY-YIG superfamily endonuclease